MFQYHSQISEIKKEIENGKIGKVHSYHARFGFPRRDKNDFKLRGRNKYYGWSREW